MAIVALVASLMLGPPGARAAPAHERTTAPGLDWAAARAPGRPGGAKLPRGRAVGSYPRASLKHLLAGTPSPVDSLNILVLRASFVDTSIASSHDSVYFANELRHVSEYYLGASLGRFHVLTTLAPGIVTLSHPEAYYGDDDLWAKRMAEMLIELVEKSDARIDFAKYDAFAVIHADAGQETDFNGDSPDQVWSGFVSPEEMAEALKDTLHTSGVPTNDSLGGAPFSIDNLMIWPEDASQDGEIFGSLGIYAYQLALRIGMLPLFDSTPSGFPDSQGIGTFDLTSYGLYNAAGFIPAFPSAFNRYLMGWVQPVTIDGDASVRLVDIDSAAPTDTALIKIPISASEYFLVDNRVHDTNFNGKFDFIDLNGNGFPENEDTLRGAEFDFFLTATTDLEENGKRVTGSGIMVWHVDEGAIRRELASGGNPNDDRSWKGVDLEEADHVQDMDKPGGLYSFGSYEDSYRKGNNDRFAPDTDPSSASNTGLRTGIEISDISEAGHVMRLHVHVARPGAFTRGEFPGDIARLSPIAVDFLGVASYEELLMAADSAALYVADVGLPAWDGSVRKLDVQDGGVWTAPPVVGYDIQNDRNEIFITSSGGILHAYDMTGHSVTIDDDATPGTLKLRGDSLSTLMLGLSPSSSCSTPVLAFSSTADSTYLMIINCPDAWAGAGGVFRGTRGIEIGLMKGQIASTPALGAVRTGLNTTILGVHFATFDARRGLCFNFLPLLTDGSVSLDPDHIRSEAVRITDRPAGFLTISTGDVNRDLSDEVVAAVPGQGLYYYLPGRYFYHVPLQGSHPSAPILADIDGDGTLETALRDESRCYLFTGFGVPVTGWPIAIDEKVAEHDSQIPPPPPIVEDVNGDGRTEVLFNIGGDIHAFDFEGREIEGWPLQGEGARGGALAIVSSVASPRAGRKYVVHCASTLPYSRNEGMGGAPSAVSSIRRYDPGVEDAWLSQVWRTYRHDSAGSGHQQNPTPVNPSREPRVDPSTFIVYPNPALGRSVTFRVLITAPSEVKVRVFTIEGESVFSATRTHRWSNGSTVPFEETIPTSKLSSGVYVCHLEVSGDGWSWSGSKKFAVTR